MNITYLQGNAETWPLPESAKAPPLPESAKTPPLSESGKAPPLSESGKAPPLSESAKAPPLPESAEIPPLPESSPETSHQKLEEIARKTKTQLQELIKSKGGQAGFYPRFTVAIKGQKVGRLSISVFPVSVPFFASI